MDVTKLWDYRVVRKELDDGSDEWYSIQEVYYDDETGKPMAQTIDLMIEGDTITGMRTQLEKMINCLGQPVLDESDIVGESNHENDTYIYESPDGGQTLYRRKIGETTREIKDTTNEDAEQWKKDVLKRGGI